MTLHTLGWTPFFERSFEHLSDPSTLTPARVTRQDRHHYRVHDGSAVFSARLTGGTHPPFDPPAVGDWVAIESQPREDPALIRAVLPRSSAFTRKRAGETTREQVVAANVDTVFLMMGLDGDFNLRRIERYVTQTWNSGAIPVIVLNKADLCTDLDDRRQAVEAVAPGIEVHALSAETGAGIEALTPYLQPGRTVALVGSSGVGKSTLVNRLLGTDAMKTGAVRADDSRGRHTTTHRELLLLPGSGLLIDTPGLRELQLWGSEADLQGSFADIEALAATCRFRDCRHDTEPGCAVRAALDDGELDPDRFRSYLKLRKELHYLERRQQEAGTYQERARKKEIAKMHKFISRGHPKRR